MTRVVPALHDRHAPTSLQDAFHEALEAYEDWNFGDPEPTVGFEGKDVPISSIFGRMRSSDDIVPEKVRLAFHAAAAPFATDIDARDLTYAHVAARMRDLAIERLREGGRGKSGAS